MYWMTSWGLLKGPGRDGPTERTPLQLRIAGTTYMAGDRLPRRSFSGCSTDYYQGYLLPVSGRAEPEIIRNPKYGMINSSKREMGGTGPNPDQSE